MNKFYGNGGFFEPMCEAAAKTFDQTITAFADSGKKVLRVLEVGAGKYFPWTGEELAERELMFLQVPAF